MKRRIYLDQAATSWPKLPAAVEAAEQFVRECGATSGRGTYSSAIEAQQWVTRARRELSRLVGARDAGEIAFCSSGTHALNAAIFGWIRPGDHVVSTAIEHNSVLRPLRHLEQTRGVTMSVAPCDPSGWVDTQSIASLINAKTRALIVGHASNVTGRVQDIAAWSQLAQEHELMLIVDASQTLGYVPLDMQRLGVDVLVAAGHKGLRALPGTGFVAARRECHTALEPLMYGGTGVASESLDSDNAWPNSIEVGNLNIPAIVSMAVAAEHLSVQDESQWNAWRPTLRKLVSGIGQRAGTRIRIIGHDASTDASTEASSHPPRYLPVVSLLPENWDIHDAASVLDGSFGIECRAGFHCAALVHNYLGTMSTGGTLRLSLGHEANTIDTEEATEALGCLVDSQ